jgi:hypothetical protein
MMTSAVRGEGRSGALDRALACTTLVSSASSGSKYPAANNSVSADACKYAQTPSRVTMNGKYSLRRSVSNAISGWAAAKPGTCQSIFQKGTEISRQFN